MGRHLSLPVSILCHAELVLGVPRDGLLPVSMGSIVWPWDTSTSFPSILKIIIGMKKPHLRVLRVLCEIFSLAKLAKNAEMWSLNTMP